MIMVHPMHFCIIIKAEVTEDDGTTKVVNRLYRYDITNGKFTNPKLIFEIPSFPDCSS